MRRWLIVALVSLFALPAFAQDLTLKRVMLSSGGLGYFEYEATVEGDANLKLTVSLDQVDDVLKSLVVYDDKGGVGGLSLPGKEPLQQTFKDMPFDQAAFESPAELLDALRAPRSRSAAAAPMSGRIVSVEEETPDPQRRQDHDQAHARRAAHRQRHPAVHPRGRREPAVRRSRAARQDRPGAARHPVQPRQGLRARSSCRRAAQGKRRCASPTSSRRRSGRRPTG